MSVTNEQLLAATTPAALAALESAMEEAKGVQESQEQASAADAATAAQPTDSASPSAPQQTETPAEPVGIATKSGSGVLPFKVLAEERQQKQHWKAQATTLQEQLAEAQRKLQELQAHGGTAAQQKQAIEDLSDEEIEAAGEDFPLLKKLAQKVKALEKAPQATPATDPQEAADEQAAAEHQAYLAAMEAIKDKPLLARAHAAGGVLWARAVELDQQLASDPTATFASLSQRAAKVQELLAAEIGAAIPAPSQQTQAPALKPVEPQPFRPNTTSDLMGGSAPQGDGINDSADGMALARRFATMTPEQLQAAIRRAM